MLKEQYLIPRGRARKPVDEGPAISPGRWSGHRDTRGDLKLARPTTWRGDAAADPLQMQQAVIHRTTKSRRTMLRPNTGPGKEDPLLKIGFRGLPGREGDPAPARPVAGNGVVRVAILPPADALAVGRLDSDGVTLGHDECFRRDVAFAAIAAIGAVGDHRLDVDPIPGGVVEHQNG